MVRNVNLFCPICGVVVERAPFGPLLDLTALEWYQILRSNAIPPKLQPRSVV
ncbi:hypothetical protein AbraIFM66951_003155 [Aspergillus brasiliensis]|uniref:Uncharacterized protein n=1 Tax=Aspergillus brasiliensis TaxID=319629 RepID=A0A9W5Z0V7_9EURO|nr:hypothetical protein AbraCBS73388_002477 [Aspergillus brasiliensis]GKZ50164.1 hypothetical protein AbraIFM66951_003155 [Aspergillus brasiliensis]